MAMTVISPAHSATVVLDGEIDIATGPAIRRSLMAAIRGGNVQLAVDMSGVAFIDAAGIGVLVDAAKRARRAGGGLSLLAPSWPVRRLLDLFHLDEILPVAPRSGDRFVAVSAALTPHGATPRGRLPAAVPAVASAVPRGFCRRRPVRPPGRSSGRIATVRG